MCISTMGTLFDGAIVRMSGVSRLESNKKLHKNDLVEKV